ncbi:MAG: HEAT repeat domain-containing protein [Candidatus Zixiibacteriota bacterium]|nr:MAG: HEAT repeat domain-containing protein [candidate division Zixibacteria bacterium]
MMETWNESSRKSLHSVVLLLVLLAMSSPVFGQQEQQAVLDSLWIRASSGELKYRDLVEPSKQALAEMPEQSVPYLVGKLDTRSAREMHTLVDIFKRIGPAAVESLVEALSSDNHDVVRLACRCLGPIEDKKATPPLLNLFLEEDFRVRSAAVKAVGEIGDTIATEEVIQMLSDSTETVRKSASVALGKIGDRKAIKPLVVALGDKHFSVRYTAVNSLGSLSPEANEELLQELENLLQKKQSESLTEEESFHLYFVVQALGELKEKKAVGFLQEMLQVDDDWACRAFAAEALGEIGEITVVSSLEEAREKERNPFALTKIESAIDKLREEF